MLAWLEELFNAFANVLLSILPSSPFAKYISAFGELPFLGWLNWFIPIKACLVVFSSWLIAVGLFYAYSIIMRWLKMIGD